MSFGQFFRDKVLGKKPPVDPPADMPDIARDSEDRFVDTSDIPEAKPEFFASAKVSARGVTHDRCGTTTTLGDDKYTGLLYDPGNHHKIFCNHCSSTFRREEFKWAGTDVVVGA